jgi:hypothetical protein
VGPLGRLLRRPGRAAEGRERTALHTASPAELERLIAEGRASRVLDYDFAVLDEDRYAEEDEPHKPRFAHPWDRWTGVATRYQLAGGVELTGSRGKLVWYLPARSAEASAALGLPQGMGIKIRKIGLTPNLGNELEQLATETAIQNEFAARNLAPHVREVALVRIAREIETPWLGRTLRFPAGNVFPAQVMEDIEPIPMPAGSVRLNEDYTFEGPVVEEIRRTARELRIRTHDIVLGNLFFTQAGWRLVDFHKWRRA